MLETVFNYKTKYKEGFTKEEIDSLLKNYPDINMDKFEDALMGITCMMIDDRMIVYHCDIDHAIKCGMENRRLTLLEWD